MKTLPILLKDGYKVGHKFQYPENTTLVYSNLTPRKSRTDADEIVFFGLQYFIKEYLIRQFDENFFGRPKEDVLNLYKRRINSYLGKDCITYSHIEDLHDLGYLPLEIKALPEGSLVPMRVPVFTIINTLPEFFWLTNMLETLLSANQGHSVHIDLNLNPAIPPDRLFHGTVAKFLDAIKAEGLKKMQRQHVHLSFEISTAEKVGNRRGKAFVLGVRSGLMHHDGFTFYISDNGVWLTDHVPVKYIVFDNDYKTSGEL